MIVYKTCDLRRWVLLTEFCELGWSQTKMLYVTFWKKEKRNEMQIIVYKSNVYVSW